MTTVTNSMNFIVAFTGSGAVTPVFVLTGKDLLLDVLSPVVLEEEDEFRWKFALNKKQEESVMRVSYNHKTRIFGRYKGRAAISLQNYSLHLRNMQQADSGLYSAKIERDEDELVGEYNVTVQDPVSPVELTVEFASNSSDSCILTVTCCTRVSDHINSILRCVNSTCSLNGGEMSKVTASGASLKIYLVDGTISCSHSNEVSSSIKRTSAMYFYANQLFHSKLPRRVGAVIHCRSTTRLALPFQVCRRTYDVLKTINCKIKIDDMTAPKTPPPC
uniref:Immunoglobulin V-set domain-containing protein n=1 Tax=Scophthalmus maximus TaxID=52904 RepID=A0A8D3DA08_SCOMX